MTGVVVSFFEQERNVSRVKWNSVYGIDKSERMA